jgi:cyanosortase A-associated protein
VKLRLTRRNLILGLQLSIAISVLGKISIDPNSQEINDPTLKFPEQITLANWQQIDSQPFNDRAIPQSSDFKGRNIGGQIYHYTQNDRYLTITLRYLVDTNGDLRPVIKQKTGKIAPFVYEDTKVGEYGMYSDDRQAYLISCINPQGKTTVSSDRFRHNSLRYSLNFGRILDWFSGKGSILNKKCLWTHFALPLGNSTAEDLYPVLEAAWFDWDRWWSSHKSQLLIEKVGKREQ